MERQPMAGSRGMRVCASMSNLGNACSISSHRAQVCTRPTQGGPRGVVGNEGQDRRVPHRDGQRSDQ
eukprot:11857161-Alexandrium_andersonii.AAC.1